MKPGTVVELAGLATLALVAVVIWMDGVPNEVVVILVLGILGIAAPRSLEVLLEFRQGK